MNRRGVTLIELSVVLAIIGILSALAGAAIQEITGKSSPQNAAADLSGALALGHSRAVERSVDIYLIVYPNRDPLSAVGAGSYFLLEDRSGGFRTGIPAPLHAVPTMKYTTFDPLTPHPTAADGVLLEEKHLDRYPQRTVQFGATGTLAFKAPFTGLGGDCSFCTGAGSTRHGAIVFHSDGSTEFLAADGTPAVMVPGTAAGRSAALGIMSKDLSRQYLFGISSTTGKIASVNK